MHDAITKDGLDIYTRKPYRLVMQCSILNLSVNEGLGHESEGTVSTLIAPPFMRSKACCCRTGRNVDGERAQGEGHWPFVQDDKSNGDVGTVKNGSVLQKGKDVPKVPSRGPFALDSFSVAPP